MNGNHCKVCCITLALSILFTPLWTQSTKWLGGAGDWHIAANWSKGLPGSMDSAVIEMQNSMVTITGGFSTSPRHVYIDSSCTLLIEPGGQLEIANAPGNGVYCKGKIQNQGLLTVAQAVATGVFMLGSFLNTGNITVKGCNVAFDIGFADTCKNQGILNIFDSVIGLGLRNSSSLINDGLININKIDLEGFTLIGVPAYFENNGKLQISEIGRSGIRNYYSEIINNDSIIISDTAMDPGAYYGFFNDSLGTPPSKGMTNHGVLLIERNLGDGFFNDHGAILINHGELLILGNTGKGFFNKARSSFTSTSGSTILIDLNTSDPLDIEDSHFEIHLGAELDALNN